MSFPKKHSVIAQTTFVFGLAGLILSVSSQMAEAQIEWTNVIIDPGNTRNEHGSRLKKQAHI